jgi:uncharacterized phage protein gp47/JayE
VPYSIPTLDELHDFLVGVGRALLSTRNWSRRFPAWKWFRAVASAATDLHAHIRVAIDDLLPDRASAPYLSRWGAILGMPQKPATRARGLNVLRVFGAAGSSVATTDTLVHDASGTRFQIYANQTIPALADHMDVSIIAIDAGTAGRLTSGESLSFDATPAGLSEIGQLVGDVNLDGADQESPEAYRTRILTRFSDPPRGGAFADYQAWAEAETGIDAAFPYSIRQGLGSVDLAALHTGRGADRLLSGGEISDLYDAVAAKKPVGVTFRVLTVAAQAQNVHIAVTDDGQPQNVRDWDDTVGLYVDTWTVGSRLLKFLTDRPDSMDVGDRLMIFRGDGEQVVIESLSGTDSVVLETVPSYTPTAADQVYSGGPLVDPVREAVLEHYDSLGTSNPDAYSYGPWEANLRPANLFAIAQSIAGVKGSSVLTPSTVIEPPDNPYPDDATVFVLVPGTVMVRYL